jgi:hypothetical protein
LYDIEVPRMYIVDVTINEKQNKVIAGEIVYVSTAVVG